MVKNRVKKLIVGIVLITMLAPVGVWAMDGNNEEEQKEDGETGARALSFQVDEHRRIVEQLRLNKGFFNNAIRKNRKDEVVAILATGVDVNETDSYGTSPVEVASAYGDFEMVELLLDNGADVSQVSFEIIKGVPRIFHDTAIKDINVDVMRTLIMAGAPVILKPIAENAVVEVKTIQYDCRGFSEENYDYYDLVNYNRALNFFSSMIHPFVMRTLLEAQDWLSEDIQKDKDCMSHVPVSQLLKLVGDYADFYDGRGDYNHVQESSEYNEFLALVGEDVHKKIVFDGVSLNKIMKREIDRRRKQREAGQSSLRGAQEKRSVAHVQATVKKEEIKEAAAQEFAAVQKFDENAQKIACFNCALLNSAIESYCVDCGAPLTDV